MSDESYGEEPGRPAGPPAARKLTELERAEAFRRDFEAALGHLSHQQQDFVQHFLLDPHPARAAERAGYATASVPYALLARPDVRRAIDSGRAHYLHALRFDHLAWFHEVWTLATSDLGEIDVDDEGKLALPAGREHVRRAVKKITRRVKHLRDGTRSVETMVELHSKIDALRLVGQYAGLLGQAEPFADEPAPPPPPPGLEVRDVLGD